MDGDLDFIPLPEDSLELRALVDFCPVFFEKDLTFCQSSPGATVHRQWPHQPLALHAANYGHTMNWENGDTSPWTVVEEFFTFRAAATMHCLNMLEHLIDETLSNIKSENFDSTSLELVTTFDHAQTALLRYASQQEDLLRHLRSRKFSELWMIDTSQAALTSRALDKERIEEDIRFLSHRAHTLAELCESGRSTIRSNAAIEESKHERAETRLITQLTAITYRLTFVFLPISYITSVFGMNFRQFGQGDLDIWLWVTVTLPILILCVIGVEFGGSIRYAVRKWAESLAGCKAD